MRDGEQYRESRDRKRGRNRPRDRDKIKRVIGFRSEVRIKIGNGRELGFLLLGLAARSIDVKSEGIHSGCGSTTTGSWSLVHASAGGQITSRATSAGRHPPPISSPVLVNDCACNRHFSFRLDNTYSSMRPIRAGVPQGSTLSPLLYFAYVNDIPRPPTGVQLALFADDTALYLRSNYIRNILPR
ncbi:Probable RNA-directed DNA polymerase from transposon BS [Eumeta japonica]|uniref:Probable RNA-directed DNA polymerase from transposon BS n=1 Tax=Eumeta variegata TaxID=151549 RepID=A0A4C1XQD1_EUMVA|nr:Probable RNA-directed DNA polymerase from transposon BS [Eumeta japonica]